MRLLEEKYDALNAPLYAQRAEIVTGNFEPKADDLPEADKASFTDPSSTDPKGIPEFWLQVLQNSDFEDQIFEQDIDALKHLRDISCVSREKEFDIVFTFADNPYFSNKVLKKTYRFEDEPDGSEALIGAEATKIEWNPGKNLTVTTITQKRKQKGKVKNVVRTEPRESFFKFFSPKTQPDEDEDEDEHILDEIEIDFELGRMLKDTIIPHAVLWFTGELSPEPDMGDFSGLGGLGDDEEEDDDDEEDDEEDFLPRSRRGGRAGPGHAHSHPHPHGHHHSHDHPPRKHSGPSSKPGTSPPKGAGGTSPLEQPAECKQQ